MQVQVLCIIYLKSYWWLILCINNFLFFLCDIILSGDSIFSNLCPHISYKIYLTNHEMSHSLNNLPQGAYEKPVNIVQLNIFQLASSLSNSSWCGKFNRKLHPTGINSWYSQSICLCLHTCNYLLVWGTMVMNLPHQTSHMRNFHMGKFVPCSWTLTLMAQHLQNVSKVWFDFLMRLYLP